ncbi:MarR family winged helix-turn-helix transcriptional regulator [Serpentinicella alkaliphila]|uniref:DNA-binding MarR family transcriptional regulator n=1 Tax=Serpentinicella alkaliphila TaxID=1734049 RepID=A0A4R2TK88_9FIRM|nr:MarR family transcriptional regulator [Serpentinicella alkaliphila]QUH26484.1 MarR family transcriptional regulator [Serpentinicella alkaliphila]TCQ03236.1 DNA-binding MarR family transcriptional regulator [Serpentinicella alkaliphila]
MLKDIKAYEKLREIIRIFERNLGALKANEITCCGITMAQCHALVEIGRAENISLNELANILDLDNSTMSRTVNGLVDNGYAKRDINPKDRRYVTISLEEKGYGLFEGIESEMNEYFKKVYETIPEKKRDQVIESLEILLKSIKINDCCK